MIFFLKNHSKLLYNYFFLFIYSLFSFSTLNLFILHIYYSPSKLTINAITLNINMYTFFHSLIHLHLLSLSSSLSFFFYICISILIHKQIKAYTYPLLFILFPLISPRSLSLFTLNTFLHYTHHITFIPLSSFPHILSLPPPSLSSTSTPPSPLTSLRGPTGCGRC